LQKLRNSLIFLFFILFLAGCVSKHGIRLDYYDECNEYYDASGIYHKDCNDLLEF